MVPDIQLSKQLKISVIILVLALLGLTPHTADAVDAASAHRTVSAQDTGSISGTVTNEAGEPLSNVKVAIMKRTVVLEWGIDRLETVAEVGTDEAGYYIANVESATYALSFDPPSPYLKEWYGDSKIFLEGFNTFQDVVVGENEDVQNIDAVLELPGTLTGTILWPGEPPFFRTELDITYIDPIDSRFYGIFDETDIDQNGRFTIEGLFPGTYIVQIDPKISPYESFYYGNTHNREEATRITINSGETTKISMQVEPGGISGRVTDVDGAGIDGLQIRAFERNDDVWSPRFFEKIITIEPNGDYSFVGLDTGQYRICFSAPNFITECYDDSAQPLGQSDIGPAIDNGQDVEVEFGEITPNINATLTRISSSISGRVTDEAGNPLGEIEVGYLDGGEFFEFATYTNSDGRYEISGLSAGSYVLGFNISGSAPYLREAYDDVFIADDGTFDETQVTPIDVGPGQQVSSIDAQLARFATLSGTVTNGVGEPLTAANVTAYRFNEDGTRDTSVTLYTSTHGSGDYSFVDIPAGLYRIGFEDSFFFLYEPEFYDNVDSLEAAADVRVGEGEAVTGINAQLELPPASLAGTLTNPVGEPLAEFDADLYLFDESLTEWVPQNSARTDSSGVFAFYNLSPNTYRLGFREIYGRNYPEQFYENAPTVESATDLIVTGEGTLQIDVVLAPLGNTTGSISGAISLSGDDPIGTVDIEIYQPDPDYSDRWMPYGFDQITGRPDYTIDGLPPGEYRLCFSRQNGGPGEPIYVAECYDDATTVGNATTIVVGEGNLNVTGINVELVRQSDLTGSFSGTVTDDEGGTLSDIDVAVWTFDERIDRYVGPIANTQTLSDGTYVVDDLPQATYLALFGQNSVYKPQWYFNANDIAEAGEIVVVVREETTGVDVSLTPLNRIEGNVTDPDGKPLADISVNLYRPAETAQAATGIGDGWALAVETRTDADGRFHVLDVPPARYRLEFVDTAGRYHSEFLGDAFYFEQTTDVELGERTVIEDVDVSLALTSELNVAPLAQADGIDVAEGGSTTALANGRFSLLANDRDAEGSALTARLVAEPQHGTLALNADGTFIYAHDGSETTRDAFAYLASDGVNNSEATTVTIAIEPVNDAPVAVGDSVRVEQGGTATGNLIDNDTDAEGAPLTARLMDGPAYGTLTLDPDGTFVYVHNDSDIVSDAFTYVVSDGQAESATAKVMIAVDVVPVQSSLQLFLPMVRR